MSAMSGTTLRFAAPQASLDLAPAWTIRQHRRQSVPGKLFFMHWQRMAISLNLRLACTANRRPGTAAAHPDC